MYDWIVGTKQYISISLYRTEDISLLNNYMNIFHKFFDDTYSVNYGDPEFLCDMLKEKDATNECIYRSSEKQVKLNTKIHFCHKGDDIEDIRGYVIWENHRKDINKIVGDKSIPDKIEFKYPTIYIEKSRGINPHEFYRLMRRKIDEYNEKYVLLRNVKILCDDDGNPTNHVTTMFKGNPSSIEERELIHIKTFFHPEKDRLWGLLKNVHFKPEYLRSLGQAPQANLLFYGPPGVGKSSFAYRIAMALNRHIVSLDIRDIRSRSKMFQVLNNPNIKGLDVHPKNCVFVFEEFDISIKILYKEMQIREKKIKKWENDINTFNIDDYLSKLPMLDKEEDDTDNKNDDKTVTSKKERPRRKRYSFIPELDLTDDKQKFSLTDLLELFQGTVPNDGAIIIATTNHYDEIKQMCPALFRPGRLTPVYFGYVNRTILQQISMFYFNKELTIYIPDEIRVPTSQIIQIALEAISMDAEDKFDYFSMELEKIL